jgi:hypothetical protein
VTVIALRSMPAFVNNDQQKPEYVKTGMGSEMTVGKCYFGTIPNLKIRHFRVF